MAYDPHVLANTFYIYPSYLLSLSFVSIASYCCWLWLARNAVHDRSLWIISISSLHLYNQWVLACRPLCPGSFVVLTYIIILPLKITQCCGDSFIYLIFFKRDKAILSSLINSNQCSGVVFPSSSKNNAVVLYLCWMGLPPALLLHRIAILALHQEALMLPDLHVGLLSWWFCKIIRVRSIFRIGPALTVGIYFVVGIIPFL